MIVINPGKLDVANEYDPNSFETETLEDTDKELVEAIESNTSSKDDEVFLNRADQVQKCIDTIRKKSILSEVLVDLSKTAEIIQNVMKYERVGPQDPERKYKLEKRQFYRR
jgi:hypothetical protein